MFIEKRYHPFLEFRRNGIEDLTYRPYETEDTPIMGLFS